jgi:hypothetical protein
MDGLLTSCASALDETAMAAAFKAMEQRFIETVPQIGLYFKTNALLYDSSMAIADDIRDLNVYTTLPQWYLYVKNSAGDVVTNEEAAAEAAASAAGTPSAQASPTPTATAGTEG